LGHVHVGGSVGDDWFEERLSVKLTIGVEQRPPLTHESVVAEAKWTVEVAEVRDASCVERLEGIVH
jgi:hypothetical protein